MSLYCIHSVREGDLLEKLISELIEKLYDIGTVSEATEILGGFTNRGFGIRTQKDSNSSVYFVRRYKDVVTRKEIQFEHALINHAIGNGMTIRADRRRRGPTFSPKKYRLNCRRHSPLSGIYFASHQIAILNHGLWPTVIVGLFDIKFRFVCSKTL